MVILEGRQFFKKEPMVFLEELQISQIVDIFCCLYLTWNDKVKFDVRCEKYMVFIAWVVDSDQTVFLGWLEVKSA